MKIRGTRITDSDGLLSLAEEADNGPGGRPRNRSVYVDKLKRDIHPDGLHVCAFSMPHNGVELRTQWIVRVKDGIGKELSPGLWGIDIWLDVEFSTFEALTRVPEVAEREAM